MTTGSYMVGLDLGQATDFSALAVVERVQVLPPGMSAEHYTRRLGGPTEPELTTELRVRHLQRWDLGTPYPAIVSDVAALMRTDELADSWLVYDATGVGRAIKDLLWAAYTRGEMGKNPAWPIHIHGGDRSSTHGTPKRDLIAALQVPLQQGTFKIPEGLPLGNALERELTGFRMKLSASGRDSYDIARRDGAGHGDLVIAVALAALRPNLNVPVPVAAAVGYEAGKTR